MYKTLQDAGLSARDFDWYISDLETNLIISELRNGDDWISGDVLEHVLNTPGLQFIWAVFSAFAPGTGGFEVADPPSADGNGRYWRAPNVQPQLDGALFEIVCWDSSATLLIGLPEANQLLFLNTNPDAKCLSSVWPRNLV